MFRRFFLFLMAATVLSGCDGDDNKVDGGKDDEGKGGDEQVSFAPCGGDVAGSWVASEIPASEPAEACSAFSHYRGSVKVQLSIAGDGSMEMNRETKAIFDGVETRLNCDPYSDLSPDEACNALSARYDSACYLADSSCICTSGSVTTNQTLKGRCKTKGNRIECAASQLCDSEGCASSANKMSGDYCVKGNQILFKDDADGHVYRYTK